MKNEGYSRRKLRFFIILIYLLGINGNVLSCKGESVPVFTVTMAMSEKVFSGGKQPELAFGIIGLGDIDFATISVTSDNINLVVNTFSMCQSVVGIEGYRVIKEIDTTDMPENVRQRMTFEILSASLQEREQYVMGGSVQFTTKGMKPGIYELKVTLLLKSNGQNYIFEDVATYRITNWREQWGPHFVTWVLSLLTTLMVFYLRGKRKNR